VAFGVGNSMLAVLAPLRQGEAVNSRVAVSPEIEVTVRYFGRHRSGAIRDAVVLR
jgi:hypothetical protein